MIMEPFALQALDQIMIGLSDPGVAPVAEHSHGASFDVNLTRQSGGNRRIGVGLVENKMKRQVHGRASEGAFPAMLPSKSDRLAAVNLPRILPRLVRPRDPAQRVPCKPVCSPSVRGVSTRA